MPLVDLKACREMRWNEEIRLKAVEISKNIEVLWDSEEEY